MKGVEQAVVLVGGEGTRLRPLTNTRPKPLLPVLERPCMEYVLGSLEGAGVRTIYIACGYRAMDIVRAMGRRDRGADLVFAFEEEPAGTAGAVKLLEEVLEGTFIVASGDVLADVDMLRLIRYHRRKGAAATMALTQVERPQEFGIVGLDDEGRIERFKEKPAPDEVFSNLVNAGIYVLESEVLEHIPKGGMFDFSKNLFPKLLERGDPLFGVELEGMWRDIGRPEDLLEANILMADRKGGEMKVDGAKVDGGISGSAPFAYGAGLRGPLHFGRGVQIGKGSVVDSAVLGARVKAGRDTHIERSLILDDCFIGEGCRLSGTILGEGCIVEDGAEAIRCVLGDRVEVESGSKLEDIRLG